MNTVLRVAEWGDECQPFQVANRPPIHHVPGKNFVHDRLWEYARGHPGFYGWLHVVNRRIDRVMFGRPGLMDLPDRFWRDEYNGRVPPNEAADVAIDEAAAELGVHRT